MMTGTSNGSVASMSIAGRSAGSGAGARSCWRDTAMPISNSQIRTNPIAAPKPPPGDSSGAAAAATGARGAAFSGAGAGTGGCEALDVAAIAAIRESSP